MATLFATKTTLAFRSSLRTAAPTAARAFTKAPTSPAAAAATVQPSSRARSRAVHRRAEEAGAAATEKGASSSPPSPSSEYVATSPFLRTLIDRGFFHQCTDLEALDEKLNGPEPVVAYLGFDATASSLHVGSLLQIMLLRHYQRSGHKPLVLVGGGTTKVGDPSGKDESRKMLDEAAIEANVAGISSVFGKFLAFGDGPTDAEMVNNDEWLSSLNYLEFLRDYGPSFTINRMMSYESVKMRLEREQPLTFLEFNYMILQAYDFLELHRRKQCVLQFGGSDQWGNIVNGIELSRKQAGAAVFGVTAPLITTADGKKMGKSAAGAVWLNEDLLSPYDYWQFWRNTADSDVARFLKLFTELPLEEIHALAPNGADGPFDASINAAKVVLADECTSLLHGAAVLDGIKQTAEAMFSQKTGAAGGDKSDLPRFGVSAEALAGEGTPLVDVLIGLKMAKSKAEARRLIKGGGARVGGEKATDEALCLTAAAHFADGGAEVVVSAGKKRHGVLYVNEE